MAATEFYDTAEKSYAMDGKNLSGPQMVDFLASWVDQYPICSIEDGCSEDDWETWKLLTDRLGSKFQLVGDEPVLLPMFDDCNAGLMRDCQ